MSAEARIAEVEIWNNMGGSYTAAGQSGPSDRQIANAKDHELARFDVVIASPEGGAEFKSKTPKFSGDSHHIKQINWARGQARTYVLFDPGHPGKCEIDTERLEKEFGPVNGPDGPRTRLAIPMQSKLETTGNVSLGQMFGAAQPEAATTGDYTAKLNQLADMHSSGALTDEEFSAAKARLLGT